MLLIYFRDRDQTIGNDIDAVMLIMVPIIMTKMALHKKWCVYLNVFPNSAIAFKFVWLSSKSMSEIKYRGKRITALEEKNFNLSATHYIF